jgi:acyl carrier protein
MYDEIVLESKKNAPDLINFNEKRNVSNVFVEPTTTTEKIIADHWGSILGYQPVGILDNYFEVGGNSLLATKLLTQLSDEFEISLVFRELSECVSIKELAVLIESKIKINELVESIEMDNDDKNYIEL